MGLRINITHDGETYNNAYINSIVQKTVKINTEWVMEIGINIWTENKKLPITSIAEVIVNHTPGQCIHQEAYNHIKSMPEFSSAWDDI